MNSFSLRLWLAAILMTCGWVGTTWVRQGYTFEVQPLGRGLESLPIELDGYQGTDVPLDERVKEILQADSTVNRSYVRPDGTSMTLHISAWIRPETIASVAPHSPKICYTNAGWEIKEERNVKTTTAEGDVPLIVLLLERDGERCVVAYWYQMGRSSFNTAREARKIHRELWGKKSWPATLKFLLQTPAREGIDTALPRIEEFVGTVYPWVVGL